jgi:hypothetical protein
MAGHKIQQAQLFSGSPATGLKLIVMANGGFGLRSWHFEEFLVHMTAQISRDILWGFASAWAL